MNMNGTGNQNSQHNSREAWPGEREPGRSDAELAYQHINDAFITSFKAAIPIPTRIDGYVEYLRTGTLNPLLVAENRPLYWPISDSSDQAQEDHGCPAVQIAEYVKICSEKFISEAFFLQDIPSVAFYQQPEPLYFTLAMACIGSSIDPAQSSYSAERSSRLWWSSLRLLMRQLEVDNREARKMELVKAWVLLETYGLLSSDRLTWNRTSMVHGYVETAFWRLLDSMKDSQNNKGNDSDRHRERSDLCSLASYFALIDLLRSIHYGQALGLAAPEILCKVKPSREIARTSNNQHQSQSDPENTLIELIGILSQIHTVAIVFDPLFRVGSGRSENSTKWKIYDCIPFSGMTELAEMTRKLRKNLEHWQNTYLGTATTHVRILWHFCRMYLAVPSLQVLIELSKYPCRASSVSSSVFNTTPDTTLSIATIASHLRHGKEALEHAWKILQLSTGCKSSIATSVWMPLVLFTAALTVWANISIEEDSNAFASLQMLQLFSAEITKFEFSCSTEMSAVLKRLPGTAMGTTSG